MLTRYPVRDLQSSLGLEARRSTWVRRRRCCRGDVRRVRSGSFL